MWVIDIGVPFSSEFDTFEVANRIETNVVPSGAAAAGSGFGYRDMQFEFDGFWEAFQVVQDVREYFSTQDIKVEGPFDQSTGEDAYIGLYNERLLA